MRSYWRTYMNGNTRTTINLKDGTRIRETKDDEFRPAFADNMDIKICNYCTANCPMCHEGSSKNGKFGDILGEPFFDTLHPYQEIAIGGGDPMTHPDLVPFLEKMKAMHVLANITVHQESFMLNYDKIRELSEKELVHGIGVSLHCLDEEFLEKVSAVPNTVVHVINGMVSVEDLKQMEDKGLKILILGYKDLRRGHDLLGVKQDEIVRRQANLRKYWTKMVGHFEVISFDNLAIEQLHVKEAIPDDLWEEFYAGDDGSHTFYIDAVERKFAKSSTAAMEDRYGLLDDVDDMFRVIQEKERAAGDC